MIGAENGGNVYFFIGTLVTLWLLAAFVIGDQMVRIWSLDFTKIGAMTIAQVYYTSRSRIVVAFVAMVIMSWPLWLEIIGYDRAVFRDGKLALVLDSGQVVLQKTWDATTSGAEVVPLLYGELPTLETKLEIPTADNSGIKGVFVVAIKGKNNRELSLQRLEYCLNVGIMGNIFTRSRNLVTHVVSESPHFMMLCQKASKLKTEEMDGTSHLKVKRELLEIAETISDDLWSRFGIWIIDVDFRPETQ